MTSENDTLVHIEAFFNTLEEPARSRALKALARLRNARTAGGKIDGYAKVFSHLL